MGKFSPLEVMAEGEDQPNMDLIRKFLNSDTPNLPDDLSGYKPYSQFNITSHPNFNDRRGEEWPTANLKREVELLPSTPSEMTKMDVLRRAMAPMPPVTPLGQQLGVDDIMKMQEFQKLIQPDLYGHFSPEATGVRASSIPSAPPMPPANIQAPEPQGYQGPVPNISTNHFGPKTQFNMGVTLPGGLNMGGSYTTPYDWKATLGLRREF